MAARMATGKAVAARAAVAETTNPAQPAATAAVVGWVTAGTGKAGVAMAVDGGGLAVDRGG